MDEDLKKYRAEVLAADAKAMESFDKTVLSLSSGALGLSFAFVKDIVGPDPITNAGFLFFAWICWGLSMTAILTSFWLSHLAHRRVVEQVDTGKIYTEPFGGWYTRATEICNVLGIALFAVGVFSVILFVRLNLEM